MPKDQSGPVAAGVREVFSEHASAPEVAAQRDTSPLGRVSATAREEIDNRDALERQLHRHDELWKRERNKIASASDPYPDFDLGSRGHRNIDSEYRERRFVWEQAKDEIENRFAAQGEDIRAQGQTLSNEFTFSHAAPVHAPEHTAAAPSPPAAPGQAHDFVVSGNDARALLSGHDFAVASPERSQAMRR